MSLKSDNVRVIFYSYFCTIQSERFTKLHNSSTSHAETVCSASSSVLTGITVTILLFLSFVFFIMIIIINIVVNNNICIVIFLFRTTGSNLKMPRYKWSTAFTPNCTWMFFCFVLVVAFLLLFFKFFLGCHVRHGDSFSSSYFLHSGRGRRRRKKRKKKNKKDSRASIVLWVTTTCSTDWRSWRWRNNLLLSWFINFLDESIDFFIYIYLFYFVQYSVYKMVSSCHTMSIVWFRFGF